MSLEAIQKAYKAFQNDETILFYTDEETVDIINAIAQFILKKEGHAEVPSVEKKITTIPEGYLPIENAVEKIGIISRTTLTRYCGMTDFLKACAVVPIIKGRKRYYVHPQNALDYLMENSTTFRNRQNRIDSMKK